MSFFEGAEWLKLAKITLSKWPARRQLTLIYGPHDSVNCIFWYSDTKFRVFYIILLILTQSRQDTRRMTCLLAKARTVINRRGHGKTGQNGNNQALQTGVLAGLVMSGLLTILYITDKFGHNRALNRPKMARIARNVQYWQPGMTNLANIAKTPMPQGNNHVESTPLTGNGVSIPGSGHGLVPGIWEYGNSGHVRCFRPGIKAKYG